MSCIKKGSVVFYVVGVLFLASSISSCEQKTSQSAAKTVAYNAVLDSVNHLYDSGQQDRALNYLDSNTKNFQLSYDQQAAYYTIHFNYYIHIKKNNAKALQYVDSLLKLSKTAKTQEIYNHTHSVGLFYRGDVLFNEEKYNEAYFNYYQGKLASSQSSKLKECTLSGYSYRMGMILYKQEHYRTAAYYFKKSFAESRTCEATFGSFYLEQELLNNIGISYNKVNELDSALLYFKKALNYLNNSANKKFIVADSLLNTARGVIYGNQASVYIKLKDIDKAKALLKKSIAINVQRGYDNNDAVLSQLKLVRLYEKLNQTDSVPAVLNAVQKQLTIKNNEEARADWAYLTANYFEHKQNLSQAIKYLKKYDTLKTILNNKALTLRSADITEDLKRIEKDHEFDDLKKTNNQKNLIIILAAIFFAMAVIILLLIYYNWRRTKKLLQALSSLNEEIFSKNIDLEKALQKLELSGLDKDRILRTVAHDLRNPIGGIGSLTSSIIEDENCTDELRTCLYLVKDTAYNTLELINEILEATNTAADNTGMQLVDINSLLNNSVELLRFKAAEKKQQVTLELLNNPERLLISREKIWRVVSNLISNAIKFSPAGGTIKVKAVKVNDYIQISVSDNGIGIPETMKESVFDMFTKAKRPGTAGEKPFGLGLSICKQIIELHNGKIWLESKEQAGTTFYFKLACYNENIKQANQIMN